MRNRRFWGAMLVEPLAIVDATMLLKTDDFSLDSHRKIYAVMIHLSEVGHAVDIVTVGEELSKRKEVDAIGGRAYLRGSARICRGGFQLKAMSGLCGINP